MLSIVADAMMVATGRNGYKPDHREADMRRRYLAQQQQKIDAQRQRDIARIGAQR